MIDLRKVAEDIHAYQVICQRRGMEIDLDKVLSLDEQRRSLQLQIDQNKSKQKQLATNQDYE